MTSRAKPKVWVVDDREENRTRFSDSHSAEFDVTTFENPDQLLRAIRTDRPDALLCDIFFYANAVLESARLRNTFRSGILAPQRRLRKRCKRLTPMQISCLDMRRT
jgi:CheY-like chemotaxis protein